MIPDYKEIEKLKLRDQVSAWRSAYYDMNLYYIEKLNIPYEVIKDIGLALEKKDKEICADIKLIEAHIRERNEILQRLKNIEIEIRYYKDMLEEQKRASDSNTNSTL